VAEVQPSGRAAPKPARRKIAKVKKVKPAPSGLLQPYRPNGSGPGAMAPEMITDLQRLAGNRAVSTLLHSSSDSQPSVQLVPVSAQFHETLYNKESATGQAHAPAAGFTGGTPTTVANPGAASYEMTRSADNSGVTVLIKVRFMQQARNTVAPPSPNPTGLPELGALIGMPTEIPANDPTGRRAWATDVANRAATLWTGRRIVFATTDHGPPASEGVGAGAGAPPPTPVPLRLPVTFQSQAVFGAAEGAHQQVIVHPPSSVPGSPGHPIDAGNWYQQDPDPTKRAAAYPHSDDVIYAHEYGHMLGIPDEYSQSNEQLNALLHQAAPASAASSRGALDKTTVERMTLAALSRPLYAALQSAMPTVATGLAAKRTAVTNKLAAAARAGVITPEVRTELQTELTAESDAKIQPSIPRVVSFETTKNFSNLGLAREAVSGAFAVGALNTLIGDAYWKALQAPHKTNVAVAGFDDVRINISSGIYGTTGAATPLAAPAAAEATSVVGPASGGVGLPPVTPPASLVGQLSALPATWSAAGSQLETAVTPAAFSTAMAAGLKSAAAARAAVAAALALLPGAPAPAKLAASGPLYRRAYELINGAAKAASRQVVNDLLLATMEPTLTASVTSLQSAINAEVTRITTTPPAGVAAAGPADPQMASIVAAMKARLDADKTATAGTGRDPTAGGGSAPDQDVTYSAQGLMGSSNSSAVRIDQMKPMIDAFNAQLRKAPREDAFSVDVGH
jgi:hypothetical protein